MSLEEEMGELPGQQVQCILPSCMHTEMYTHKLTERNIHVNYIIVLPSAHSTVSSLSMVEGIYEYNPFSYTNLPLPINAH